ncbi:MAG: cytochrome c oxidase subunit II [Kaistia sp. SCN 65-12]|nr:MAG: cytochrome c oxidase subunit II [Kaistia sp. SCN 65-12]
MASASAAILGGLTGAAQAAQPTPWAVWSQTAASPIQGMIERFNAGITIVMALVVVVVLALIIYCVVRFNAKANPVPSKTSHNTMIEVIWTLAPILILIGISVPSFSLLFAQADPARIVKDYDPDKVMTIKATGLQWYWNYEYPDNEGIAFDSTMLEDKDRTDPVNQPRLLAVDNEMIVPVGTVVRLQVIGADVIHSFAMPSFGLKLDAVPGRLNETWFLAEREGMYYGQCSELCGINHAYMPIAIRVVKPEQFQAWAAQAKDDLQGAYKTLAATLAKDKVAQASEAAVEVAAR